MQFQFKRNILRSGIRATMLIAVTVSLTACGGSKGVRGYIFDTELADAIQPGVDNRQSVEATLGNPTIPATFGDDTWYYVSTTVRIRPIFWPDAKEHRVMAVNFNENGVVSGVTNYDLSHRQEIKPVKDKTPTKGRSLNFFQQIFSSIGQFAGQAAPGSVGRGPNGS